VHRSRPQGRRALVPLSTAGPLPPRDALAIADAALRRGLVTPTELAAAVERQARRPGITGARTVISMSDPRRETALESWSAWSFHEQGVPPPVWQATLCDREGTFLGRVDGWWGEGVAGEADGRMKYRLAALEHGGVSAEGLAAALDQERQRERPLRPAGVLVVRWSAHDVLDPCAARALAGDLCEQIGRGGTFRGRAVLLESGPSTCDQASSSQSGSRW
jgi:hypothetical protein